MQIQLLLLLSHYIFDHFHYLLVIISPPIGLRVPGGLALGFAPNF